MHRLVLAATVVALCATPVAAQSVRGGVNAGTGGSTGPTFPNPGPETLIATAPGPNGTNAGPDCPIMPPVAGTEEDLSGRPAGPPGPSAPRC